MKICSRCKLEKDESEFYRYPQRGGVQNYCKDCKHAYCREYYQKNKDRVRRQNKRASLKFHYGMTLEQYDEMYISQQGQCSICKTKHEVLHVDHDHNTGDIRELLCNRCNRTLGLLEEDPMIMHSMIEYVQNHDGQKVPTPLSF